MGPNSGVTSSEESQNYRISRKQQGQVLEDGAALLDGPGTLHARWVLKATGCAGKKSVPAAGWCEVCDGLPRIRSALGTSEAENWGRDAVLALNP